MLAFPAADTVHGTLVLAPGDVNLTFKEYVRTEIRLTIDDDHITAIDGDGLDAELFASYLGAFGETDAYATSHVGWGMNTGARWDVLPLTDKSQTNGTELRAFAGNFLYSTGANEVAGRLLPRALRPADAALHRHPRRTCRRRRRPTRPRTRPVDGDPRRHRRRRHPPPATPAPTPKEPSS